MKEIQFDKTTRRCFLQDTGKLCFTMALPSALLGYGQAEGSVNTDNGFEPAYLELHRAGELKQRAEELWTFMESCKLCPRRCGVNRHKGNRGFCRAPGTRLVVSASHPHFGEERPLVGEGGSGTVFLTHCNLRCVFCQNYEIALLGRGERSTVSELASMML